MKSITWKHRAVNVLIFVPAAAVLIHEAAVIMLNVGLLAALFFLGKYLITQFKPTFK